MNEKYLEERAALNLHIEKLTKKLEVIMGFNFEESRKNNRRG
jgi:hypothetical protein